MTIVTPDSALPAGRLAGWGGAGNRLGDFARMCHRWRSQDSFRNRAYGRPILLCPTEMRGLVSIRPPICSLPLVPVLAPSPLPAMLPERLAKTDAFTQIKEPVGSGPYRFKADERMAPHRNVERCDRAVDKTARPHPVRRPRQLRPRRVRLEHMHALEQMLG